MVAYSLTMLAPGPQHALAAGGLLTGGAVAGLVGKNGRANVGVGRAGRVAQLLQIVVDTRNLGGQLTCLALFVQRLHGLSVRHVGRVLAGEGELRQPQRVGAEGRRLARRDQLVRRRDGVGNVADNFDQQVVGQSGLLGPVLDVRAEFQRVVRLRMTPAVVDALVVDTCSK